MGAQTATVKAQNPRDHFRALSPGKLMGLRQITDTAGRFKVLALDQSNSFKKALRAMRERLHQSGEPAYEEIRDAKLEVTVVLGVYASAVLLDVNYGLRQALAAGALPRGVGLIGRVEASRDAGLPGELEPGWGVSQIKRMGCSAVKLLVYMDVEDRAATEAQLRFVRRIHADCEREDILLMTEELSYPRKGEDKKSPAYVERRPKNIIESAQWLGPYTDVLKLEFPADLSWPESRIRENLAALNEAAIRPWVLLSAGEKFDKFAVQVEMTLKAGCNGIMAGRAIFNEYFEQNTPQERHNFLVATGTERIKKLCSLVDQHSPSWLDRYGLKWKDLAASVDPHWYSDEKAAGPQPEVQGEY